MCAPTVGEHLPRRLHESGVERVTLTPLGDDHSERRRRSVDERQQSVDAAELKDALHTCWAVEEQQALGVGP